MSACTSTPISWLRLERYRDGELDDAERARIAEHLLACTACRACFHRIEEDTRELPPLPALPTAPAQRRSKALFVASGLALAAALLFAVGRVPRDDEPMARMKGDGIAFTLVRDDQTVLGDASGTYREGDRWKALVTCPAGSRSTFDLVVYERGDAAFPLEPAKHLDCGNEVPLPGAFSLRGRERLVVCLVWGDEIDRDELRRMSPDLLPRAACKVLDPAP